MTTYIQLLCKSCFVQLCAVQHPTRPSLFFINACIGFLQLMWLPSGALKKVCPLWAAMISTDAVSREEGQGWQPPERKVFAAQDGLVQSSADSKQELTWMGCSEWWVSTGSDLEEMLCWLAFSDAHSGFLVTTFCATRALENKSNGTQLTYLPTSHSIQLLHINSLFFFYCAVQDWGQRLSFVDGVHGELCRLITRTKDGLKNQSARGFPHAWLFTAPKGRVICNTGSPSP